LPLQYADEKDLENVETLKKARAQTTCGSILARTTQACVGSETPTPLGAFFGRISLRDGQNVGRFCCNADIAATSATKSGQRPQNHGRNFRVENTETRERERERPEEMDAFAGFWKDS